jgi:RNA polymerase sigma factor (sigma-70 family)
VASDALNLTLPGRPLVPRRLLGDDALGRLAAHGDARAFELIAARHQQALYRYCRAILRNDEDARDALQATLISAWSALARERREIRIRPWLFRIAHNESITVLRRRPPLAAATHVDRPDPATLESTVATRDRLATLLADLGELSERQRSALIMRELSGLSHVEVGEALGTSTAAAKDAIFQARKVLQELDEGRAMTCETVARTLSDGDGRRVRSRSVRAHLRACGRCRSFAAALDSRPRQLGMLAPPMTVAAAASLLGAAEHGAPTAGAIAGSKAAIVSIAAKGWVAVALAATAAAGGGVAIRAATLGARPPRSHAGRVAPRPAREDAVARQLDGTATRPAAALRRDGGARPPHGGDGAGRGAASAPSARAGRSGRAGNAGATLATVAPGRSINAHVRLPAAALKGVGHADAPHAGGRGARGSAPAHAATPAVPSAAGPPPVTIVHGTPPAFAGGRPAPNCHPTFGPVPRSCSR